MRSVGERGLLGSAEVAEPLGVAEVEEQPVRDVEVVGEREQSLAERAVDWCCRSSGSSTRCISIAVWIVVDSTPAPDGGVCADGQQVLLALVLEVAVARLDRGHLLGRESGELGEEVAGPAQGRRQADKPDRAAAHVPPAAQYAGDLRAGAALVGVDLVEQHQVDRHRAGPDADQRGAWSRRSSVG